MSRKKVVKEVPAKVAKKVIKKAVTKVAPVRTIRAVKEQMTRSQVIEEISTQTELSKKEVKAVIDELGVLINRHVKKGAVGTFNLAGMLKIKTIRKPAQKARKGVPNPFRPGETMDVAAKPARTVVKALPLKSLKDMVV